MKRLGVVGTMVWDRIHRADHPTDAVEEWGGIAYALAAFEAFLPDDWEFVPLIKVGADLSEAANVFRRNLARGSGDFVLVPEPNNRVVLRYEAMQRRTERLTGGVPSWRWDELAPRVHDLDAIYVNFISGWELDLECARALRARFEGPIYADLHSLLLGIGPQGDRFPRPLVGAADWFWCFDIVQVNEDELGLVGEDPMATAADALRAGARLLVVTLGSRGAVYFTSRPFAFSRRAGAAGSIETARIPAPDPLDLGDTTGCGDVFGATLLADLLGGRELTDAIGEANRMAARNVTHRGATNLQYHLRGQIAPR